MPIVRREDFGTDRSPEWCKVAGGILAMGVFSCDVGSQVEAHFHDCEEFWVVTGGRARIMTDGEEYTVESGDIVCTQMGDEHAIPEIVDGPYEHVWIACNLRGPGRTGHLHRGEDEPA